MTKHHLLAIVLAFTIPACATEPQPDVVEDTRTGKADEYTGVPRLGTYVLDETRSGLPHNGDMLSLSLTARGAFQATVHDEFSGTTSHAGTYQLFTSRDETAFYIDLVEGSQRRRVEYLVDVVDLSTLWIIEPTTSRWIGMSYVGTDCGFDGTGC